MELSKVFTGREFSLRLGNIKSEIEEDSASLRTYKVTIPVEYWHSINKGGIIQNEMFSEIIVMEKKKMMFLWGKWFILNSMFSVTVA
jgi:hypothetical protein